MAQPAAAPAPKSGFQSALEGAQRALADPPAAPARPPVEQATVATTVERVAPPVRKPDLSPAGAMATPGPEERYEAALAKYNAAFNGWLKSTSDPWWSPNVDARAARNGRTTDHIAEGPWTTNAHPPLYDGPKKPQRSDFGLPPSDNVTTSTLVEAARARGYLAGSPKGALDVLPANATADQKAAFETAFLTKYAQAAKDAKIPRKALLDVLAQEVGGNGHYNELHPSSAALGFAQLLPANTIERLVENGQEIATRLRAKGLGAKADLVLRMRADIIKENGGVAPTEWKDQQRMGRTPLGYAVHAANLDQDIGVELQSTKLRVTSAQFRGYTTQAGEPNRELTGPILEAMNLAGPRNGFAMSHPANANQLSLNFFARSGYFGNAKLLSVDGEGVTSRTAAQTMTRMTEIMNGVHTNGATYRQLDAIYRKLNGEPPRAN